MEVRLKLSEVLLLLTRFKMSPKSKRRWATKFQVTTYLTNFGIVIMFSLLVARSVLSVLHQRLLLLLLLQLLRRLVEDLALLVCFDDLKIAD